MKIKRYLAASMRAALAQARAEQGADAVILSSRRTDEGIEVIAAVDFDAALFAEVNRRQHPAPAQAAVPAPAPAPAVTRPRAPQPAAAPPRSAASPPSAVSAASAASAASQSDLRLLAMRRELSDLRQLLETGLAGMTWNDQRLRDPAKARVLDALLAMDLAPDVATALAERTPLGGRLKDPAHIPLALLFSHLPVVADLASVTGGIMAIVGPTGAGKTTTIAKLAARWCLRHGNANLALVSTDGYRIGARDQLSSYAHLLGVPMHAANSGRDLSRILDRLKSKKLVLIDTAGMGPRDVRLTDQLAALRSGAPSARVLLALPAQGDGHALEQTVRSFAPAGPSACILTKVDEAASLGAVLSATLRHRLKIAYLCNGQRVPDDLHTAHRRRLWLVRTAAALQSGRAPVRDAAYFVRHFGGAHAHA